MPTRWIESKLPSFVAIVISFFCFSCTADPVCTDKSMNEFAQIVREQSLFSDSLDWPKIYSARDSFCREPGATNKELFRQFVIRELRAAGDKHSILMPADFAEKIKNSTEINSLPKGKILHHSIGYLTVNAFFSFDKSRQKAYADTLQQIIKKLDRAANVHGWIIDLRRNHGGDMWPMIAGLGPLLGNGNAGFFVTPSDSGRIEWVYSDGQFGKITVSEYYFVKQPENPIAILTGHPTSSSGEMTLVAFLGKSNVRTFGLPTGGFVTANKTYPLSDGSSFSVAASLVEDRLKRRYTDSIRPDEYIYDGIDYSNKSAWLTNDESKDSIDPVIEAAIKWIHSKE